MELHLKIIGALLIVLGTIHIVFPRYFEWKKELGSLSLINRQMTYIHTFFIAFVIFLIGLLCFTSSKEIIETNLGRKLALGIAIFGAVRLLIQFFGYSSKLWKGKIFETIIHIVFSIFWTYLSIVFFIVYRTF